MTIQVLVDGGANSKNSVDRYIHLFGTPFDLIYVFEPNPLFHDSYHGSQYVLMPQAIWTEDCILPFYISKDTNQVGSSLFRHKLCRTKDGHAVSATDTGQEYMGNDFHLKPLDINCIDFSRWLRANIDPAVHHLTVKLDIEGSEYAVLYKLINDGTISLINKLYVEFHTKHMNISDASHDQLVRSITNAGIIINHWD